MSDEQMKHSASDEALALGHPDIFALDGDTAPRELATLLAESPDLVLAMDYLTGELAPQAHAAFEAFDAHVPGVVADQLHTPVIQDPGAVSGVLAAPVSALHDGGVQLPSFDSFDQVGGIGTALPDPVDAHPADPVFEDWAHPAHDAGQVDPGHGGFDIFGHQ